MIRKFINQVNEWLEYRLRLIVAPLSPDARVIVILSMLLVFGGLSIYMTVSSIYNFGKEKGGHMQLEYIESLKLEQQRRDSINNLNNHYQYERRTE